MTAALIVAAGKTNSKENFNPGKKVGTITAIERVALLFQKAGIQRIAVVCDTDEQVKKLVPSMGLTFLPGSAGGDMFDNVKTGLSYLQGKCSEAFITYVDVPLFSIRTVNALLSSGGAVSIPAYHGRCGHPLLLRENYFPKILSYEGEGGLKGAIQAAGLEKRVVEVDDAGILSDIQKDPSYEALLPSHDIAQLRLGAQFRISRECTFYGPGVHLLLQLIGELGSLSDACRHMGISYSKGRKIIFTMEQQLGRPIIQSQQGGKHGGCSYLTETAQRMEQCYASFCAEANGALQELFQKHFSALMDELN